MKRYIITTVVPGAKIHKKFLASLSSYAEKHDATILGLVSQPLYKDDVADTSASNITFINNKEVELSTKIRISSLPVNPEAVDPIAGLDRLANLEGSLIFASPKQRLKSTATSNTSLPRVLMTPGAVTKRYYRPTRKGLIAGKDHVLGAIIVEIVGEVFHFRQIQAAKDGSFIDFGTVYSGKRTSKAITEALIPGDWHVGSTDPIVAKSVEAIAKQLKPKTLVLHDFFDGISVNHHLQDKNITKALLRDKGDLSMEISQAANELADLSKLANKVVVVRSNHDEFLDRWLEAGKYVTDQRNHIIGLELALAKAKGHSPLEAGIKSHVKLKNVKFLKVDEDFRVTSKGIQLAVHGHLGPNGARGTTAALERVYGNLVIGHHHTPEILRGCYVVGTSTKFKLDYNYGPSSWMHTMCVVYSNGSRQLINVVMGKYRG